MLHALSHDVSPATLTLCCLSRDTVLGANVLSPNTVNVWRCRDLHVWPTADSSPAQFRLSRRTRVCSSPSGSWLQAVIFLGYCSTRFIIWLSVDSLNAANRLHRSPLRRWPWTRLFDWNKTLAGGLVSSATIQVGYSRISVLWSLVWPKSTQVYSSSSTLGAVTLQVRAKFLAGNHGSEFNAQYHNVSYGFQLLLLLWFDLNFPFPYICVYYWFPMIVNVWNIVFF